MGRRSDIDWEGIRREYRAGQLSIPEIAKRFGCSAQAIHKRINKEHWERDLSQHVRRQAKAKADAADADADDDESIIEEMGARGGEVLRLHRRDIREARTLCQGMIGELREQHEMPNLKETVEAMAQDEEQRKAVAKATSLQSRARIMSDLSQSMQRLVAMERQAFNLDDDSDQHGLAERLNRARRRVDEDE